jgi:hypothetical protein
MKRFALLLCLLFVVPLFGLTRLPRPGDRIGVLQMSDRYAYGAEKSVAHTVQRDLQTELRALGFDVFEAPHTYDDLSRQDPGNADFYVKVVSSQATHRPVGGVATGAGRVGVEVGVVVSHVAAEVRLYNARTLDLVEHYDLRQSRTAVLPTAVGIGGRSIWAYIALPFIHWGQYRSAAHEVAREAAARIAGK